MEIVKELPSSEILQESDEDLLQIISWKDDLDIRNEAFAEFYKRYSTFLYSIVKTICGSFPNWYEMSNAITSNVFINVYHYSGSFKYIGEKTPFLVRSKIEGWLVGVAKTEMQALLTNKVPQTEEYQAYGKMLSATIVKKSATSYNEEIVGRALSQLKDRDQDILRTYWLFYEKGSGSQSKNMPSEALDELAERYNTTKINIRQIISRSNKVVQEFLQKNYKKDR
jgi:hypothetical protein